MANKIKTTRSIIKYKDSSFSEQEDLMAVEYPLTIMLDGEEFATMVCTPFEMDELVVGFLASEGIIRFSHEIKAMHIDEARGFAYVQLANTFRAPKDLHSKRVISSCCGKSRQFYFQSDMKTAKTSMTKLTMTPAQCQQLMLQLQQSSSDFLETGGLHNAALCTKDKIIISKTDIGRHNALDKLYGYALMHQLVLKDRVITFSGRMSSEVVLKVAKMGLGIILSKSAPTNLALDLADDLGITTVGFIRGNSFNVYTHPERISVLNEGR